MIKANELRIGNWIMKEGEPFKCSAYTTVIVERDPDQFDPIPLTPEILEKAKLNKIDGLTFSKGRLTFVVAKYESGYIVSVYFGNELLNILEYLHSFQNFIYALTGEELPIEL